MASTVRSVDVRLNAKVTKYISDVKRAGDETEKAFDRVHASTSQVREDFVQTEKSIGQTTKSTKEYGLASAIADEKAARLKKSLRDQAKAAVDAEMGITSLRTNTDHLSTSTGRADRSINQLTGRLRLAADSLAIFGPSAIPIAAIAVPAVAGLASQLGFAALGAGSLIVASQGVGDALKAVNEAALKPTAENLEKARDAMAKLGPEAQAFVSRFQELRPVLGDIRDAAARGWFPGLTESLDHFENVAPRIATIFEKIGEAGGNLVADAAESLAGPEWEEFLAFVEDNAPQALDELGRTVGNLIKGMSRLWMAFDPLNDSFSQWLLDQSRAFAEWSDGLAENAGFQEFVQYIRTNGPRVAAALAAVGDAVLEIIEALAPLGGPALQIIESFAKAVAAIADSDLGTPILAAVAAYSALNRTLLITAAIQKRLGAAQTGAGLAASAGGSGKASTALAGLTLAAGRVIPVVAAVATGMAIADAATEGFGDRVAEVQDKIDASEFEAAAEQIAELKAQAKDSDEITGLGDAISDVGKGLGRVFSGDLGFLIGKDEDKIKSLEASLEAAATTGEVTLSPALREISYRFTDAAGKAELAAAETADFADEIEGLNSVLSQQGSWDAYQAAIDGLTDSVAENGKTLDSHTASGRANRAALNDIADSAIRYSETLVGADRIDFLKNAKRQFVESAEAAGGLDARARNVLAAFDELLNLPPVAPKFDPSGINGGSAATGALTGALLGLNGITAKPRADLNRKPFDTTKARLDGALNNLNNRTIKPHVSLSGVPAVEGALAGLTRPRTVSITATYAGINKPRSPRPGEYDTGGYTGRGGKYDVAGYVHRDEVVLPTEIVHRDRDLLKQRYGHLPGMEQLASGGYAGHISGRRAATLGDPAGPYGQHQWARSDARAMAASTFTDPALLTRLEAIETAVNRNTGVTAAEHRGDRNAIRRGASNAATSKQGGYMWAP